jgi:hemerythrin superfamily protein
MAAETSPADLIRSDHREMERLFALLETPANRTMVAPVFVALLAAHSRAEESEVYPALRTDGSEEVAHSQEEHVEADRLAARLVDLDLAEGEFTTTLQKLIEKVSHHIEEEEEKVLPRLDRLPKETRSKLGRAFVRARGEHLTAGTTSFTRDELETQARNEGVEGTRSMTKEQLAAEV